ncbi:hypothetical protein ACWF62_17485 [Rhodococcus sp. NPDC054953]
MGRPATGETPKRNIRIPDDLWLAAKAKAKAEDRRITDVVVASLREYTSTPARSVDERLASVRDQVRQRLAQPPAPRPAAPMTVRTYRAMTEDGMGAVAYADAGDVARMLRDLADTYRTAPLYAGVATDLDRLADSLDAQILSAPEAPPGS